MKEIFKGYFKSFLFTPVSATILCLLFTNIIFIFFPYSIPKITDDFHFIDIITIISYVVLLATLIIFYKDFSNKTDYSIYIFLTIVAFLREMGAQHWLTTTDTTAIKIRFFTNPNNPFHEKIISFFVILAVVIPIIYIAKKFALYLVKKFLKFDTVSWSIGTFFAFAIIGEIFDRFPSGFRKHFGIALNDLIKNNMEVLEESTEMFFSFILIVAIIQYHMIKNSKFLKK